MKEYRFFYIVLIGLLLLLAFGIGVAMISYPGRDVLREVPLIGQLIGKSDRADHWPLILNQLVIRFEGRLAI